MVTLSRSRLGTGLVTLAVWALAAGSVVYWGLRLVGHGAEGRLAPPVAVAPSVTVDAQRVARVLGAVAPAADASSPASMSSRFALLGVVAGAPGGGSALIALDGQPARPYRVGHAVDDGLVLRSVGARQAILAATQEGPAVLTLEMPALKP